MAKISSLNVEIGASTGKLKKGLKDAQASIKSAFNTSPVDSFNGSIDKVTGNLGKLSATMTKVSGMLAAGFGIKSLAGDAISAGDATYRLAQRMHITAAEAGNLKKIMSLTGGDVTSLSSAMMRLDKTYTASSTEGERCRYIFDQLGLSLTDQQGRLLPVNEQLKVLATGYKAANDAGQGQEFVMNTLGVKGMALVSTLEQYSEAAEAAGRVKSIGLDPEQMHELNLQLQTMQLQASQLNLAFTAAFAPLANELLPAAMETMQELAVEIKEHKELISSVAVDIVKVVAAYEGLSVVSGIFTKLSAAYTAMTATQVAQTNTLTAAQLASIAKVEKATTAKYDKQLAAMVKNFEKETALTAEQEAKQIAMIREVEEKKAASIERMRAMQIKAYEEVNAAAAASAQARVAGERTVEGAVASTTAAHARAGAAAKAASAAAVVGSRAATVTTTAFSSAVMALRNNWMLVAVAIGYAISKLADYQQQRFNAEHGAFTENGAVNAGGGVYYEKDDHGNIYSVTHGVAQEEIGTDEDGNPIYSGEYEPTEVRTKLDRDSAEYAQANAQWLSQRGMRQSTTDANDYATAHGGLTGVTAPELDFNLGSGGGGGGGSAGGGGADNSAKKLEDAIKRIQSLSASMDKALGKNDTSLTEYQQKLADINNTIADYDKKIAEISDSIAEAGGDEELTAQLKELTDKKEKLELQLTNNLNAEWKKKNDELVAQTELAYAKMNGNYKSLLDAELAAKIAQLDAERDAKEKELAKDSADEQAKLNLLNWYGAQRFALTEEYAAKERAEWAKAYPLMAAREEAMKVLNQDFCEQLKSNWLDISKSISNDFGNAVAEFIKGSKTMTDVFQSFADSVVAQFARMAAAKVASGLFSMISGLFGGGNNYKLPTGFKPSFYLPGNASGGYITGPGTSTSDSIPAMLSNGEFVVNADATKRYRGLLERINGFAAGGYVTSPTMASSYGTYGSAGTGANIQINLKNESGTNLEAQQGTAQFDGEKWVIGVVLSAVSTNKQGIRSLIKGVATS